MNLLSYVKKIANSALTTDVPQSTPPNENFVLVWTDGTIDANKESSQNTLVQFSEIIKETRSCTDPEQCIKCLDDTNNKKAVVICSGSLGEGLVPKIHDMANVATIYIFCANKTLHEAWAKQWPKIQGVYTELQPMCESIKKLLYDSSPWMWSIDRTAQWLSEIGLEEYRTAFSENRIDGSVLTRINFIDDVLEELIPKVGPRTELKIALTELLSSTKSQTLSDSTNVLAEKEIMIGTLNDQIDSQVENIESLKNQVEAQLKRIEVQDEELVKWKEAVSNLTESNKSKGQAMLTQQHQIQAQQTQIEIQRQQIQVQQEQMQERDKQIALLGKAVEDQKKQIDVLFQTVKKLRLLPKKEASVPSILPVTHNILQNLPSGTTFIDLAPPDSSTNTAPQMQPGNPALIAISSLGGNPLPPGRSLPIIADGPSSNVTFPVRTQPNGNIAITPQVNDQYDISNYGTYEVTIFDADGQDVLVSTLITIVPEAKICVPKQFVIKDAHNSVVVGGKVTLKRKNGTVAFTGVTDNAGIVQMPNILPDDTYDVEINPNQSQLKPLNFKMVVFQNQRPLTDPYFVPIIVTNPDEMRFVLRWGTVPKDLDSHMYASNGTHIYYSQKKHGTMSLDCDVRSGNGPETITVTFQPGLKYVYAVHR